MILLSDNLEILRNQPIDVRMIFEDIAERDSFSTTSDYMYIGLISYVKSTETVYVYKESIGWDSIGSSEIPQSVLDHIANSGIHVSVDEKAAMSGTGTQPSTANKFVTFADLNESGATTYVVDDTTAMIALSQTYTITLGDRAIVINNDPNTGNGEWRAQQDSPSEIGHWLQLPDLNHVLSVAGKTGVVTLDKSDINGLTDDTVDEVVHINENGESIPEGAQWVYDIDDEEMKLVLDSGRISSSIQSTLDIGGIINATTFPIGTPVQDILAKLLSPASISYLRYTGYSSVVKVGISKSIATFIWNSNGSPNNLVLNDNVGGIPVNTPVTGNEHSFSPSIPYLLNSYGSVTWTLNGDNVTPISVSTYWVWDTFYGIKSSSDAPNVSEIENSLSILSRTSSSVTIDFGMTSADYSWFAVHKSQTGKLYNNWSMSNSASNNGDIAPGNLFYFVDEVTLSNGEVYYLYKTPYKTQHPTPATFS